MTPERLASLAAYAGDWIHADGAQGPYPCDPAVVPVPARNAVYLICAWSGRLLYVGSTTIGVAGRLRQHLADTAKTLDWSTLYVVPLRDDTPIAQVRRIEGRLGLAAAPVSNKALPRLGKVAS